MRNFEYYNPTRIVFGRNTIGELDRLVPPAAKVLLVYGGGSIKANGVYEQVRTALGGRDVVEHPGVQPNPEYEHCMAAVEVVRREGLDFLLAVGGGSVIDATKFTAAAARYETGDPWIFLERRGEVMPADAVPLGVVLTLPATGSESNPIAVVSRRERQEKMAFESDLIRPQFAVLDPQTTFSLPPVQVRNGVIDAFIHVLEQYVTFPADAPLQDRQAEAVLNTLRELGPKTLAEPTDYETRASVMWCATWALNRSLACGVPVDFATHRTGHELTALYGVAHAESLCLVLPYLWREELPRKQVKLAQYARRVWDVAEPDDTRAAELAIARTVAFFESLGMPTRMAHYGIDPADAAEKVRERLARRGWAFGEHGDLTADHIAGILRSAE